MRVLKAAVYAPLQCPPDFFGHFREVPEFPGDGVAPGRTLESLQRHVEAAAQRLQIGSAVVVPHFPAALVKVADLFQESEVGIQRKSLFQKAVAAAGVGGQAADIGGVGAPGVELLRLHAVEMTLFDVLRPCQESGRPEAEALRLGSKELGQNADGVPVELCEGRSLFLAADEDPTGIGEFIFFQHAFQGNAFRAVVVSRDVQQGPSVFFIAHQHSRGRLAGAPDDDRNPPVDVGDKGLEIHVRVLAQFFAGDESAGIPAFPKRVSM